MHGLSLMWCSVSFQIIALIVVLHFIGKAAKEAYPNWLKWMAYLLLIAGLLGLICSFASGCSSMMHRNDECKMEGTCPMMKGKCKGDMKECHGDMKECKEGKGECKHECKEGEENEAAEKGEHHDTTKVK